MGSTNTINAKWLFTPHDQVTFRPVGGVKEVKVVGINLTVSQVNNSSLDEIEETPVRSLDAEINIE